MYTQPNSFSSFPISSDPGPPRAAHVGWRLPLFMSRRSATAWISPWAGRSQGCFFPLSQWSQSHPPSPGSVETGKPQPCFRENSHLTTLFCKLLVATPAWHSSKLVLETIYLLWQISMWYGKRFDKLLNIFKTWKKRAKKTKQGAQVLHSSSTTTTEKLWLLPELIMSADL